MPVLLPPDEWELWLDPGVQDAARLAPLLRPYPDDEIAYTPVSRLVNNPRNDLPQCVEPLRV